MHTTLLTWLGEEGKNIYSKWTLTSAEIDSLDALLERFRIHIAFNSDPMTADVDYDVELKFDWNTATISTWTMFEAQVHTTLLTWLGEEGKNIYSKWTLTSAEIDSLDALLERFRIHIAFNSDPMTTDVDYSTKTTFRQVHQ